MRGWKRERGRERQTDGRKDKHRPNLAFPIQHNNPLPSRQSSPLRHHNQRFMAGQRWDLNPRPIPPLYLVALTGMIDSALQ